MTRASSTGLTLPLVACAAVSSRRAGGHAAKNSPADCCVNTAYAATCARSAHIKCAFTRVWPFTGRTMASAGQVSWQRSAACPIYMHIWLNPCTHTSMGRQTRNIHARARTHTHIHAHTYTVGTLCVFDSQPRTVFSDQDCRMLSVLAGGIEARLSLPREHLVLFMPMSYASAPLPPP